MTTKRTRHYCPTACQAEGFVYPHCLCTPEGEAEIKAADEAAWQRMFGPNGTQR